MSSMCAGSAALPLLPSLQHARTFHGLEEHRPNTKPIYIGPSHLALDRSISAPDSQSSVEEEETDTPTVDNLQHFAWNFLSRFSHVDEARERLERQTEEEHINEKEMVRCVCVGGPVLTGCRPPPLRRKS